MKRLVFMILITMAAILCCAGCVENSDSDTKQRSEQEQILLEGNAQVGIPSIKNFRERKILKDIIELRDQEGLVTYTYIVNELNGKLIYMGETIGYGIPCATQFTNPQKIEDRYEGDVAIPQADPNGLFSPESAEGTWVLLKDTNGKEAKPVYVEPRIIVSPFKLPQRLLAN